LAPGYKEIASGAASRQQIIALFGKPPNRDESGRWIGYAWSVKNGVWIYPFCFKGFDQIGVRGIEMKFDDRDVLKAFRVVGADPSGGFVGLGGAYFPPPFDQDLRRNRETEIHRFFLRDDLRCPTAPTSSSN
jgi:hypothetical protein